MKSNLSFTLTGRDWWKPYLPYWIIVLIMQGVTQGMSRSGATRGHPGTTLFVSLLVWLVLVFAAWIFMIVVLRIFASKLAYAGESFAFNGKIGEFIGVNVVGLLLSIITVGVFVPWYLRRVMAYLASHTSYKGTAFEFKGRGGRLFLYFLVGVWAPVIVLVIIGLVAGALSFASTGAVPPAFYVGIAIFVFYVVIVFVYLVYKWYVNLTWKDVQVRWNTHFWPSFGMILGQVLLCIITITIYWPAAYKRLYRYFTERTVFERGDAQFAHMGFEGEKGFGLLWGQVLLTIITIGIYAPWAYAKIGRWFLGATYVETTQA